MLKSRHLLKDSRDRGDFTNLSTINNFEVLLDLQKFTKDRVPVCIPFTKLPLRVTSYITIEHWSTKELFLVLYYLLKNITNCLFFLNSLWLHLVHVNSVCILSLCLSFLRFHIIWCSWELNFLISSRKIMNLQLSGFLLFLLL